jgi:hypothetical protein
LGNVFVLIESVFGRFAFPEIHTQFDEEEHDRLEGGDRAVARPFRGDMFVQDGEGGGGLVDGDELLRPSEHILRASMQRWRHFGCGYERWSNE